MIGVRVVNHFWVVNAYTHITHNTSNLAVNSNSKCLAINTNGYLYYLLTPIH